jgi:phage terminase small subunit
MPKGRPPQPIALHRLAGTYRPEVHASRAHEPLAEGDLRDDKPPHWLKERQKRIWHATIADAPRGILRRIDRQMFIEYVLLVDTVTEAAKAQNKLQLVDLEGRPSFYLRLMRQTIELTSKLRGEMGFSPVARTRLATADPPAEPKGFELVRVPFTKARA